MKFILSRELGRLAKWLRILGLDTAYFNRDNTNALIIQALRDDRLIITRNRRLAGSSRLKTFLVTSEKLNDQLLEVLKGLKLSINSDMMFSRCIICNINLEKVDKEKVKDKVPEYVFNTQDNFIACPECRRIYWSGTHWGNVAQTLKEIGVAL
ncbi:MAG: Mut7-C RNAse domain-containing protein [Candidatus Omnitrophica bacterium]|nr:Mut7-C RNAse domain-containing protein [Candidatus Omnitrophota bacterium]